MTQVVRTRAELESALKAVSTPPTASTDATTDNRVALVPTMGALHAGHTALMQEARRRTTDKGVLVVSIFVNPLQFGPGEDLDRYPRSFDADVALCEEHGVDLVFAPSVEEVYPDGFSTGSTTGSVTVDPGPLGTVLEGRFRPSHFRGVLTVVAKLFGLVRPDVAVFGEKDYQQLVLVRRMVADLCLPVEVVGAETVREEGGLAMSSRNAYLSEEQRVVALLLCRALHAAAEAAPTGADHALAAAHAVLREARGIDLDYLEITSPELGPPPAQGEGRVLVAARVGTTRLIDNLSVTLGEP